MGGAALLSRALGGGLPSLRATIVRYLPAYAPFAFGMWLAHYSFHFFTGFLTVIPVTQNLLLEFGMWRGEPAWGLAQVLPDGVIGRFEVLAIALGLGGTLIALHRTALAVAGERRAVAAFVPWAVLALGLCAFGLWVMSQPMEMRGTFLA